MIELETLPKGWTTAKLGDICFTTSGGTPSRKVPNYYGGNIPWVKSGELDKGLILDTDEKITDEAIKNSSAKVFPKGTLLIALYGATVGKLAFLGIDATTNQAVCGIYKSDAIESKLLYYFLQLEKSNLVSKSIGGAQPNISQGIIKDLTIPLAPLNEQRRILAKLEQLLTDLDKGIEYLETTKQQLIVYRQAVLKRAFEGEFTKEWRKSNPSKTGIHVLEEIKTLRAKTLNENFKNGDKEAKRVLSKINKHTFKAPSNTNLPKEWSWTSLMNASYLVVDCHNKTAPYVKEGIYLIRTTNVRDGKLILDQDMRFVSEETYKYWSRRCPPEPGDILFTREAPMGEVAIIPKNTKVCMGQRIMLLRTFEKYLLPKYLHYATLEPLFQQRMRKNAIGTGVKHLRVGDVEELTFPICSIDEQRQLIYEIESRLSVCDKFEETIESSLQQAEALRLSIIKKAFEGKLVPQDPNDEPAEKLLERIRAAKGKGKPEKKEKVKALKNKVALTEK